MDNQEIINSLNKYKKEEFTTIFLDETIKYFKHLNSNISEITDNEMLLTGIKLNLLYNPNKYYAYFETSLPKDILCYRKLQLTQNQANNLVNQLYGINQEDFSLICKKLKSNDKIFYFYISKSELKDKSKYLISKYNYELYSTFLGIQTLYFLEHQNLDHYCSDIILKNSKDLYKELFNYSEVYQELTWQEKDKLIIFSGLIYHFLGTLYTSDLDLIFVSNDDKNCEYYLDVFKDLDTHILLSNKTLKTKEEALPYLTLWLKYELPRLGNVDNIYTVLINPKHHFHFFGFKCLDIVINVQRTISRSNALSILDIYLLKTMNNLDFYKDFCIKNINIRQGKVIVTNDGIGLDVIYKKAVEHIKTWYNRDVTVEELKKHFIKCEKLYKTIYFKRPQFVSKLIEKVIMYNREVTRFYLKKYAFNANKLLDIGIGKGNGFYDYFKLKIKTIHGIEPSLHSIAIANERISRWKNADVKVIHGFGDIEWTDNILTKNTYDIIVLTFSIHYMIDNIDILINNINKCSKSGTYVYIFCLDGDKIFSKLKKTQYGIRYQIEYNNEPFWGVYQYNDYVPNKFTSPFKMLFYIKDTYGVNNGSEEYLVNINYLISKFNKYKLLINKNFLDNFNEINKLTNNNIKYSFQKEILGLHKVLIFQKL